MKKGFKPDFLTIIYLVRGLVGEYVSTEYKGKRAITYEHYFREITMEIANHRGFFVKPEYKFFNNINQKGSKKKLDYVFFYNEQIIGIEFKLIRKNNPNLNIENDICKLNNLSDNIDRRRYKKISAWHIILWNDNLINKNIISKDRIEKESFKTGFNKVKKSFHDSGLNLNKKRYSKNLNLRKTKKSKLNTPYITIASIDNHYAYSCAVKII